MARKQKKLVIAGDFILKILRGLNSDETVCIKGVPEDAQVEFASYDEEAGGKLTLYVSTEAEIKGDELDVTVHTSSRLLSDAMYALREIAANEAPYKRDPLEFARSVIETHVEIAEEVIRRFDDVCRVREIA